MNGSRKQIQIKIIKNVKNDKTILQEHKRQIQKLNSGLNLVLRAMSTEKFNSITRWKDFYVKILYFMFAAFEFV